jgi:hypothetical protein
MGPSQMALYNISSNDHLEHELMYLFPFDDDSSAAKHSNK